MKVIWKEQSICICECHKECVRMMHMFPCCNLTYQKYIDKDGNIIDSVLEKLLIEVNILIEEKKQKLQMENITKENGSLFTETLVKFSKKLIAIEKRKITEDELFGYMKKEMDEKEFNKIFGNYLKEKGN